MFPVKKWASPSFLLSVCLSFVLYFFSFLHSFLLFRSLVLSFFLSFLSLQICIVFPHPEPRNVCAMQRQSACRQTAFCDHIPENLSAAAAARRTPTRASHKKNKKGEEGLFENPLTTRNTWRLCLALRKWNVTLKWMNRTKQKKKKHKRKLAFQLTNRKEVWVRGGGGLLRLPEDDFRVHPPVPIRKWFEKITVGGRGTKLSFFENKILKEKNHRNQRGKNNTRTHLGTVRKRKVRCDGQTRWQRTRLPPQHYSFFYTFLFVAVNVVKISLVL